MCKSVAQKAHRSRLVIDKNAGTAVMFGIQALSVEKAQ